MIINLKKYKEHGYFKALVLIGLKLFVSKANSISKLHNKIDRNKIYSNYPRLLTKEKNDKNDKNEYHCISCKLCQTFCPENCIAVIAKDAPLHLYQGDPPQRFFIDLKNCTRCGLCVDVCPVNALDLQGSYELDDFVASQNLVHN